MNKYLEIIDKTELISRINTGKLDRSTAIDSDDRKVYAIGKDINGRACLCAIGWPQDFKRLPELR